VAAYPTQRTGGKIWVMNVKLWLRPSFGATEAGRSASLLQGAQRCLTFIGEKHPITGWQRTARGKIKTIFLP